MKEKSLIETAKMQGNVLVRRLFDSYVVYDADFVPFPHLLVPVFHSLCALTRVGCFGNAYN